MNTKATPEKIAKLPTWAREHIEELQRDTKSCKTYLTEFLDRQTPSPFYIEHYFHQLDEGHKHEKEYIQAHSITCEAHGIRLRISMAYGSTNDNSIALSWEDTGRKCQEIAFVPLSFQQARLVAKEAMR